MQGRGGGRRAQTVLLSYRQAQTAESIAEEMAKYEPAPF